MLIVIDMGHGGNDPGASGYGLVEKDVLLRLGGMVVRNLQKYEVDVVATRNEDINMSLSARAQLANNLNADYFCSLHINAGGGTGFESYVYTSASQRSETLRSLLHEDVSRFYKERGFIDRGQKKANFAVLRETRMPAVLLENLFIDNPRDAAHLSDPEFLSDLSGAISGGLVRALKLQPKQAAWDPAAEIARLKDSGLIANDHAADAAVTWGEFAAVINRLLDRMGR